MLRCHEADAAQQLDELIISGEPTILIKDGVIIEENMKKSNYSVSNLKQGLRSKDIFDIEEVEYAVLETNGALSALKKPEYRNMTLKDLKCYFPDRLSPK